MTLRIWVLLFGSGVLGACSTPQSPSGIERGGDSSPAEFEQCMNQCTRIGREGECEAFDTLTNGLCDNYLGHSGDTQ